MASRSLRLLLLGCLGVLCYCKATGISIETDNKNVKAEEFKEAILSCKHKFSKGMSLRIEWKKIQSRGVSFVYYNGDFTGDLKNRAEMLNTGIRIRNVTRKDSGTYRCEISAKSEEGQRLGEATITLTVLVPPTTPVCEVPSSAMTGTVVELSCKETEGSPPSEYQWYKNGVPLLEKTGTGSARAANVTYAMNKKSGTLLFNTVTKNDTGEYFCEASNGIGLPQKCSVRRMQVDDLNVSGIIAAVVFVALVMALCGLGVFYAQKKGYFTKESSSQSFTSLGLCYQFRVLSYLSFFSLQKLDIPQTQEKKIVYSRSLKAPHPTHSLALSVVLPDLVQEHLLHRVELLRPVEGHCREPHVPPQLHGHGGAQQGRDAQQLAQDHGGAESEEKRAVTYTRR
ncbi:Junctional adhesion molecule B isoform X1 [Aix galericulata]|nr:Junctional adhesion molecule B isoform X1 [Aix galericulata]